MNLARHKKARIVAVSVLVLIVAGIIFAKGGVTRVDAATNTILSVCSDIDDRAQCYESEVPKLYPELSVPQIFEVLRAIRAEDSAYQFCHVLAHKVGERVVTADPDAWVEAISLNPPDGYCSNGFIHGVTGGRFRSDVLDEETLATFMPDFRRACEGRSDWQPSDLDKAVCYHGLGHLYDFITNADLKRALLLCEQTTPNQFRRVCVEGVFMQIFQPLEPDDFALIEQMDVKPTEATIRKFCTAFKEPEYVGACLRESWPLHPGMLDGTGIDALCSKHPSVELEGLCYQTAFSIVGRLQLAKPMEALAACAIMPHTRAEQCYAIVANTILEEDRGNAVGAVEFCERPGSPYTEACLAFLIQTAPFNFGTNTKAYANFCAALPNSWQQRCNASIPIAPPTRRAQYPRRKGKPANRS